MGRKLSFTECRICKKMISNLPLEKPWQACAGQPGMDFCWLQEKGKRILGVSQNVRVKWLLAKDYSLCTYPHIYHVHNIAYKTVMFLKHLPSELKAPKAWSRSHVLLNVVVLPPPLKLTVGMGGVCCLVFLLGLCNGAKAWGRVRWNFGPPTFMIIYGVNPCAAVNHWNPGYDHVWHIMTFLHTFPQRHVWHDPIPGFPMKNTSDLGGIEWRDESQVPDVYQMKKVVHSHTSLGHSQTNM